MQLQRGAQSGTQGGEFARGYLLISGSANLSCMENISSKASLQRNINSQKSIKIIELTSALGITDI